MDILQSTRLEPFTNGVERGLVASGNRGLEQNAHVRGFALDLPVSAGQVQGGPRLVEQVQREPGFFSLMGGVAP